MLIAGDIGGTKTDLAVYSGESGPHSPLARTEVHTGDYPSLQAMVREFLAQTKLSVEKACFDVAGLVVNGRVKVTNVPWVIDEATLASDLNLKSVHLMNDLEAVARAVPVLRPSDLRTLNAGEPVSQGAIAVVAPGTDATIRVEFRSPQRSVAPGQSVVVYDRDRLLGGGRIVAAFR